MACSASREAEAGRVSASRAGGHAPHRRASRAIFLLFSFFAVMSDTSASSGRLWPHVVSGVSGRVTAELFMSPINLLKVRLQHNLQLKRLPVPAAMLQLARDEGALSLWRGLPPRLMWATPLSAATFTYYQAAKKVSSGEASDGAAGKRDSRIVLAGPFMLAASVAVRTPFDIAEQRLQLEPPATGADAARRPSAFRRALSVLRKLWEPRPRCWRDAGERRDAGEMAERELW